jgi:class 3 adenylate cyclase/predicted ATPase
MMETGSAASSRPTRPERRYLTILFCDLVGYTELSERLDPEDLQDIQLEYQRLGRAVMERYSGFVARFTGDGILVYFGYPTAHENDAERAVRAALELIDSLADLNARFRDQQRPEVAVRIGIHTGLVVFGSEATSGGWQEHSIVGEAVNLAARLQVEAAPNCIIVSRETLELVEGCVAFEPLGPRRLKGLSRIIALFRITKARPVAKRSIARLRRGATRMIGREKALDRLLLDWDSMIRGSRCCTVQIVGEAGVGKTRLVREFVETPELANANVVQVHCHEIFANTPLYALGSYFWWRLGLTAEDGEAARLEKISAYLDEVGGNGAENRDIIGSLMGLAISGVTEAVAPTPLILKQKQFALIVGLVEQSVRSQPSVLWVDDAHWLDPSSAELLSEIVSRLADLPLLVLLTLRSFPKGPPLPAADDVVHVEQLGSQECFDLARSVPGAQLLSDQVLARAVQGADGLPLFVEQLVLSLIDQVAAEPDVARAEGKVPLILTEMLSERLDRLPGGRRVVQAAACIGRAFTPDFLSALLHNGATDITEPLEALVGAEILRPRLDDAEARYEFRHVLLQRMAYESMVHAERRALHARIVEVLKQPAQAGPAIPEVLAHHLTAAGKVHDAINAWLDAGVKATRRSAYKEAVDHLERGLDLLAQIAQPELRRQLELELQAALIGSLTASHGPTSQELAMCCERGLQLCRDGEPTPLVFPFLFGKFTFAMCRAQIREATSLAELFLASATRSGYEPGRVIGHRLLGMAFLGQGEAGKAKEQLERSLALYSHERDAAATHLFGQNTQVHSRGLLSLALFCLGHVDEALHTGLAAIRAADMLRHPLSTTLALAYVGGWVFGLCGATEQLMHEARRMISVSEQHRLGPFPAFGRAFLGWALCQQGDLIQGIAVMEEAIEALEGFEFRLGLSAHLAILADARRRRGNPDVAEALCTRAVQMVSDTGERWFEPEARRIEALIANDLRPQEYARVEALLRAAVECARSLNSPIFELRCLGSLREFIGPGQEDVAVNARILDLSHLDNLARRVASAVLNGGPRPRT